MKHGRDGPAETDRQPWTRWLELALPAYAAGLLALGLALGWVLRLTLGYEGLYSFAYLGAEWLALACTAGLVAWGYVRASALAEAGLSSRGAGRQASTRPVDRPTAILCALAIAVSCLVFVLVGVISLRSTSRLTLPYNDQGAYLEGAALIHAQGGPLAALGRCFAGEFIQTRRDPLFLLVLAPFAPDGAASFETGKAIALVCGTLAVLSAGFVVWRLFSPAAAVVAVFGLSMNRFLVQHSTLVNCEPLYVLLSVWTVYLMVEGLKRRRLWIAAGVVAGLAHLCKGSGILFVAAFGVAALVTLKWQALRDKHVWGFALAFVTVLLPFLVDATVKHGNPLHNPNAKLMWADSWDEATKLTPEQLERLGPWTYARTHTAAQAWARMRGGIREVSRYFVTTSDLRILPLLRMYASGAAVLLLAGLALAFDRNRFRQAIVLCVVPLFYLLIGWLQGIGTSERHILPLVPFVFAYFGQFISGACAGDDAGRSRAWRRVAAAHLVAGLACVLLLLVMNSRLIFGAA